MKISTAFASLALCALSLPHAHVQAQTAYYKYVDPFIGSEKEGNVVIGPSRPHGMVKPSPENKNNASTGYSSDLSTPIYGFSQLHVSGTGGSPKYGNISIMPFAATTDNFNSIKQSSVRQNETTGAGYYSSMLTQSNIKAEITAASRVAFYRFSFDGSATKALSSTLAPSWLASSKAPLTNTNA